MSILDFFHFFRQKEPRVSMQAHPVDVQPNARAVRNAQRIQRIEAAMASGDKRPGLRNELKRRKAGGR